MELMQLQEDDVDAKIRQAEEELANLRKQRALIELQNQLAEEQRLLADAQQIPPQITAVHPVVHPDPPHFLGRYPVVALEPEQPRFKRSDSELTLAQEDGLLAFPEHTPMLPVTKVYHGIHRKEFLQLMRRLETHFAEWPHYYATDDNKVVEACRHLSEGIAVKWALVRLTPEDRRTWPEFCVWLNSNIRNFVNPDIAERRYKAARQRRGQTVNRFAKILGSLEVNLPRLVTDYERCERLWIGVLPEVRNASRSGFPASYHTGVTQLIAAGRTLTRERPRRKRRRGGRRAAAAAV
ncbi:uncharacterized protein DSM5745_08694 [Aspergillus mulundensis]|uniref:Retrotransposon gag domain-containing protein n=1 Tax=Aspergillus mulundensis TaxID=1810919 RepID=A0A3D8R547_9EURO|nr:hypothetical protein DSM5745_08694 [Aspergillus mulundensis]RDW68934.1 hypothetical protein DSM5745_08694 [Aspergillus mulundensis]